MALLRWVHGAAFLIVLALSGRPGVSAELDPPSLTLSEMLRLTLERQPALQIQESVRDAAEADVTGAAAQFDLRLSADALREHEVTRLAGAAGGGDADTDTTSYSVGLLKQLRSGLRIQPQLRWIRVDAGVTPLPNRATATLGLTQPLLRGRGAEATTAVLRAATSEADAAAQELRHVTAQALVRTAQTYWNYAAVSSRLEVAVESEQRARSLAEEGRVLVAADKRPAADMKQLDANLADRTSARLVAEQTLEQARHDLGLAAGLGLDEIAQLPLPADDLPAPPEELDTRQRAALATLAETALAQRNDLRAAADRERSAGAIEAGARDGLKPRLDLSVSSGYSGLQEGEGFDLYFTPFRRDLAGPSLSVSLELEWPFANRAAHSRLAGALAQSQVSGLRRRDLERSIRSSVTLLAADLTRSAERVRSAQHAGRLYRSAIEDEREKLKLGKSTVVDMLNTEDRLTRTLLDEVGARLAYAIALARLRFETGTLLPEGPPDGATVKDHLVSVPVVPALGSHP
jgi:outer membrane protein